MSMGRKRSGTRAARSRALFQTSSSGLATPVSKPVSLQAILGNSGSQVAVPECTASSNWRLSIET